MTIKEAAELLGCDIILDGHNLDKPLSSACGADLMSDVLAFAKHGSLLLTGMVNQHVIRTAEMLDVECIVFVRGKRPTPELCALAKQTGVTLFCCSHSLYAACGLLYKQGLPPCSQV